MSNNKNKGIFKEYYSKLAIEGLLRAFIIGAIIGLSAAFVFSFVAFWINLNPILGAVLIFVGITIAVGLPVYFVFFRPSTVQIARRVDRLGLDERLITMLQLEKDESYIALRQREDAKTKIKSINRKSLKISIFIVPLIIMLTLTALSASMTTVSALSVEGKLSWGPNRKYDPELDDVVITYIANEGGYLEGDEIQIIRKGENGSAVIAVADEGYAFEGWSDGFSSAARTDRIVQSDITVYASFVQLEEGEAGDDESDSKGGSQKKENDGRPKSLVEKKQDKEGNDNNEPDENGQPRDVGSGKYENFNQIINGKTYYRDDLINYLKEARERFENGELPPHLWEMVENYFRIIQ